MMHARHFDRSNIPKATHPKLRGYAFDSRLSTRLENVGLNEVTFKMHWEDRHTCNLEPACGATLSVGPVGAYLEIVDFDPASVRSHKPDDLNDPFLLSQDDPPYSEGNQQFHRQMLDAVVMTKTLRFEHGLGGRVPWRPLQKYEPDFAEYDDNNQFDRAASRDKLCRGFEIDS